MEITDASIGRDVLAGVVAAYLVERYVPGSTIGQVQACAERLATAGETAAASGIAVTYLGSTFVPGDEAVFDVLLAPSADAVAEVNQRAGTVAARISEAILIAPHTPRISTPHAAG